MKQTRGWNVWAWD